MADGKFSGARPSTALADKVYDVDVRGVGDTIPPPYEPESLWRIYERSAILRPCIEAMVANVGGSFGFTLVPEVDLGRPDVDKQIRTALIMDRLADGQLPMVTDDMVTAAKMDIELAMDLERARLEVWFRHVAQDMSFMELCQRRVRSQQVTGCAYWEVMRDSTGEPARIKHLPATTMRFTAFDKEDTEVIVPERTSMVTVRPTRTRRKLRRYVQLDRGVVDTYFKSFGDLRTMSADTGVYYTSVVALQEAEGALARVATEVYYFDQLSTDLTDYGIPQWIGVAIAVLGSREAEEANYLYWTDNGVPEMIIAVAGGKPAADLQQKLENYIRDRKGQQVRWSPMIITAESGQGPPPMQGSAAGSQARIAVVPLRSDKGDALGQAYERDNARKVQQQWRLPDLLVGRSEEANKAQAEAARAHAEEQIFIPARMQFDSVMNRILGAKGIRYWRFESNGPKSSDAIGLVNMVKIVCQAGIITPAEAREIVGPAFGRAFDRLDHPWTRIPLEWFKAQMPPPPDQVVDKDKPTNDECRAIRTVNDVRRAAGLTLLPSPAGDVLLSSLQSATADAVVKMLAARDEMRRARDEAEWQTLTEVRKREAAGGGDEVEHVTVDPATWATWFSADG